MKNFETNPSSDSLNLSLEDNQFESQLRENPLGGTPQNRDSVFYECGRASVAVELTAMKKSVQRYRAVSLAALLACVVLGGTFAFRMSDSTPPRLAQQTEVSSENDLESLKRMFANAKPSDHSQLRASSSIEDIARIPEQPIDRTNPRSREQSKPTRVVDIKHWL